MKSQVPTSDGDSPNMVGAGGATASVWQGGSKFGGSITLGKGGRLKLGNSVKGSHNGHHIRQEGQNSLLKWLWRRTAA